MERKSLLILVLAFVFVLGGLGIFNLVNSSSTIDGVRTVDMHLEISDKAGFNVDTDALYFGRTTPGTQSSTRFFNVSNDKEYPVKFVMETQGDLGKWTQLSESVFVLEPGEGKEVRISVLPPKDAPFGEYEGKLRVVTYKRF